MNEKGDVVNASYYHIVNSSTNTAVGAEVTHSFYQCEHHHRGYTTCIRSINHNQGKGEQCRQHKRTHPARVALEIPLYHFLRGGYRVHR
ncbi:hypothetical protein Gotri_016182 [Gossypium trilobum]|uniref:Uncharacterized protein n=1 Tax=Gossypium trilobum TaxID=34281 RepID=A0A7J9E2L8_9ROSI|nr:hypothetical protein [Gossypium trilobum]